MLTFTLMSLTFAGSSHKCMNTVFVKQSISKEINDAQHKFMNMSPPPHLSIFCDPWVGLRQRLMFNFTHFAILLCTEILYFFLMLAN